MDNQHRKVTGYRDFTPDELALINRIKAKAEEVGVLVKELENGAHLTTMPMKEDSAIGETINTQADKRWVAIGRTHLQEGFMALARSVAKPTTF